MYRPTKDSQITLFGIAYKHAANPIMPSYAHAMEGAKGTIYRLHHSSNSHTKALKVFKQIYASRTLVESSGKLDKLAAIRGLSACKREVITKSNHSDLISKFPELEFSVLMPWINGLSWQELLLSPRILTRHGSLVMARNLAATLLELQKQGHAHSDIAGANLIVSPVDGSVHLIDVEDMFGPGMPRPAGKGLPAGQDGYQHHTAKQSGTWNINGDRFAASILISEMLLWHLPEARPVSGGNGTFFDPADLHYERSPRFQWAREHLNSVWGNGPVSLLDQAWHSRNLDECPHIQNWVNVLETLQQPQGSQGIVIDPPSEAARQAERPTFQPTPAMRVIRSSTAPSYRAIPSVPTKREVTAKTILIAMALIIVIVLGVSAVARSIRAAQEEARIASYMATSSALGTAAAKEQLTATAVSQDATATAATNATSTAAVQESALRIFGPRSGTLAHNDDEFIEVYSTDVDIRDFVAQVTFTNPYSPSQGSWDYGFAFRDNDSGHFRLVITSDRFWILENLRNGEFEELDFGESNSIQVNGGQENIIRLVTDGIGGTLYINGREIADLDLRLRMNSGSFWLITGHFEGDEIAGEATRFTDFEIFEIP